MTNTRKEHTVRPYGARDETLLAEGRYREWFYQGLEEDSIIYLRQPPRDQYRFVCNSCKLKKPLHEFTKNTVDTNRRCNSCILNSKTTSILEDADRWENKHDPKHWADEAACLDADPELFAPASTNEYLDPSAGWRQYCPVCPIRDLCIEQIEDSTPIPQGIFGGKLYHLQGVLDETTAKRRGRPRKA
jgi:hypothetical protein